MKAQLATAILVLVFVGAGAGKLAGVQQLVDNFRRWGFPDWFRMLVGAAEVGCAALLLVPGYARIGCAGIVLIMGGAMHTHLVLEPKPPAVVLCAVLAVLAVWLGITSGSRARRTEPPAGPPPAAS